MGFLVEAERMLNMLWSWAEPYITQKGIPFRKAYKSSFSVMDSRIRNMAMMELFILSYTSIVQFSGKGMVTF